MESKSRLVSLLLLQSASLKLKNMKIIARTLQSSRLPRHQPLAPSIVPEEIREPDLTLIKSKRALPQVRYNRLRRRSRQLQNLAMADL